jgi:hypothetical protein
VATWDSTKPGPLQPRYPTHSKPYCQNYVFLYVELFSTLQLFQGSQTRQRILQEPTSKSSNKAICLEDNKYDNEIIEGSMQRRAWAECFLHRTQQLQK